MARTIPVADDAIAQVALTALLADVMNASPVATAEAVVEAAARVQFQPSTRRLVLTFDLGMSPTEGT